MDDIKSYLQYLFTRLFVALFFVILGIRIIESIFGPITFYLSYYTLQYYNPILISSTEFIINEIKLKFIPACIASGAYLLLIILTLMTEMEFRKALKTIAQGFLIILIANLIRIDLLVILLVNNYSDLFNTLHLLIWKTLSTLFVVLLWIILTKINKIENIPIYSDYKKILGIIKEAKR
ncbi:pacearchaeosortase [Candidatus Woesearchaeota archaeon]|nr:pacearchaeosortase [Candidatus Woesearchaeota archaeon]